MVLNIIYNDKFDIKIKDCKSIRFVNQKGDFSVLDNHQSLTTNLQNCYIFCDNSSDSEYFIEKGVAHIENNVCNIFAK